MNKTKKNRTFTLLKIVFPVRGSHKESLKQSMISTGAIKLHGN